MSGTIWHDNNNNKFSSSLPYTNPISTLQDMKYSSLLGMLRIAILKIPQYAKLALTFLPHLSIYIEKNQMVSTRQEEIHAGIVSMNYFVLRTVKNGIVDWKHSSNGQDLLWALVSGEFPAKKESDVGCYCGGNKVRLNNSNKSNQKTSEEKENRQTERKRHTLTINWWKAKQIHDLKS